VGVFRPIINIGQHLVYVSLLHFPILRHNSRAQDPLQRPAMQPPSPPILRKCHMKVPSKSTHSRVSDGRSRSISFNSSWTYETRREGLFEYATDLACSNSTASSYEFKTITSCSSFFIYTMSPTTVQNPRQRPNKAQVRTVALLPSRIGPPHLNLSLRT